VLQYGFRPSNLSITVTDNNIPGNPFGQLAQLSPAQKFDPQTYSTVSLPQGNVIDELIKQWGSYNPNPS
jgi:hypothetical protein